MASNDEIEPEYVAMRTRSRNPMNVESLGTLLAKLETNDEVTSHHERHQSQGNRVGDEHDSEDELEASVQQMEMELERTKARALRMQRKRELIEKMERMQDELEYYQKMESSMGHHSPPMFNSMRGSHQQKDEWCEELNDSASSISFQSSRHELPSYTGNTNGRRSGEVDRIAPRYSDLPIETPRHTAATASSRGQTATNTEVKPEVNEKTEMTQSRLAISESVHIDYIPEPNALIHVQAGEQEHPVRNHDAIPAVPVNGTNDIHKPNSSMRVNAGQQEHPAYSHAIPAVSEPVVIQEPNTSTRDVQGDQEFPAHSHVEREQYQYQQTQQPEYQYDAASALLTLGNHGTRQSPNMLYDGQSNNNRVTDRTEELLIHQSNLTKLLIDQQVKTTLPPNQIPIFTGSPLEYTNFITAFEYGVESKTHDNRDRLYYLSQYTTGQANRLVKSCMHLPPAEGYFKAKGLLNKEFGNKHKIAESIMQKANDWAVIKSEDGKALSEFALFLSECEIMMKGLDYLVELNHTTTIRMLSNKLPYILRRKWRSRTDVILEDHNRLVNFGDLVEFLEKEARILNNPIYGRIADTTPSKKLPTQTQSQRKPTAKRSSFATSAKEEREQRKCVYCDKTNHTVTQCYKLQNKPLEERLEYVKSKRLCFGCAKEGHMKSACPNRDTVKCKTCGKKHPTLLHDPDRGKKNAQTGTKHHDEQQSKQPSVKPNERVTSGRVALQSVDENEATNPLMSIVPVLVRQQLGEKCVATYAFLDNGCGAVFADTDLTQELNATTRRRKLLLGTLISEEVVDSEVVIEKLQVGRLDGESFIDLPSSIYIKGKIPVSPEDRPTQQEVNKWPHLAHIVLPELDCHSNQYICIPKVTILIGSNAPAATMPLKTAVGEVGEPYGIYTPLGWAIYGIPGKLNNQVLAHYCSSHTVIKDGLEDLEQQFKAYISQEFNERLNDDRVEMSQEDRRFLQIASTSIELKDGHYQMNLPFRDTEVHVPNNRDQVHRRTELLKRRFVKDPVFYEDYKKAMQQVIDKGYAEPVPDEEITRTDGRTWYIPHHGVHQPEKKKVRVVYDCAASYHGTSLNQQLLQGPDLTNTLIGVLLRFRQEQVALMSDVEAMFYQVRVKREDVDMLRFLWWPDGDTQKPLQDYRMLVHIFGATSSPACANYALKQTAQDNQNQFDTEVLDTVHNNFYVDDCVTSTPTEAKAIKLAQDLIMLCQRGGFRLTKWTSNRVNVLKAVPASERSDTVKSLELDGDSIHKALGMVWLMEPDHFTFRVTIGNKPMTRRGMLSTLCSLYDPLGLASPVILPAKQILQELCRRKIGWDEEVPVEIKDRWSKWTTSIPELQKLTVPRCWKPVGYEAAEVQLHHFADASESGYGTASYLRLINSDGAIDCNLIISKSRVAPLKRVSIPRMELTAATTAVRVDTMLKRELDIQGETVFWSDSQTVLKYIRNEKARYQVFVANRIAVIRDGSTSEQWRYVPSELNPADYVSRGMTVNQLMKRPDWLKGPEFLSQPEEEWPAVDEEPLEPKEPETTSVPVINVNAVRTEEEDDDENMNEDGKIKKSKIKEQIHHVLGEDDAGSKMGKEKKESKKTEDMMKSRNTVEKLIQYYSDWTRLRRAVAWMLRLKKMLLKGTVDKNQQDGKYLTLDEIKEAEIAIIDFVQHHAFADEIKTLNSMNEVETGTEISKPTSGNRRKRLSKNSSVWNLDPKYSGGLLRVGGRLSNALIPEDARHQLILPKDSHVSDLIIKHFHHKCNHQGKNHTIAELRQQFWIIKAGAAVKKLLRRCFICRKVRAKVSTQKMADLPSSRVQFGEPPFTYTGMDFFGPFEIKHGRSIRKRYGVLFTCLVSRAVHIEVADSLDTSSCINALRRFISRRGQVKEMTSDNGTNLVGTNRELSQSIKDLDEEALQKFSSSLEIKWRFNPPGASHHGGCWERQIRTVRKVLQSILQEQHVKGAQSDDHLHTLMCEIEATINGRPLTRATDDDPHDLNVITPNDLLLLKSPASMPPGKFGDKDLYARKRWRQVQYLANLFWKRWIKEYLPMLQARQKWLQPQRNMQVGDVVLIVDESAPRNSWPMGVVQEVHVGNKGLVRSVKVKTKSSVLVRPISKLCLLLEQEQ